MAKSRNEVAYIRAKARQFRQLAGSYEPAISSKLLEIAAQLEAHARKLEEGQGNFRAPEPSLTGAPALNPDRTRSFRRQVRETLQQAADRAEAGQPDAATKLIEFATEMELLADGLGRPAGTDAQNEANRRSSAIALASRGEPDDRRQRRKRRRPGDADSRRPEL